MLDIAALMLWMVTAIVTIVDLRALREQLVAARDELAEHRAEAAKEREQQRQQLRIVAKVLMDHHKEVRAILRTTIVPDCASAEVPAKEGEE